MFNNEIIDQLKTDMMVAAKRAYQRGIQTGSGGNFSVRVPGEELMLVKASGGSFIDVDHDGILITDFDGNLVSGDGKPTREAVLHGYLYKSRPDIDAVMHCHAPYSIVWASNNEILENVTFHSLLKLNSECPILRIESPMVRKQDFGMIDDMFKKYANLSAFILYKHGIVAVAKDILTAEHHAELVEETAQIASFNKIMRKLA